MTATLDPLARVALDRRLLVQAAWKYMDEEAANRYARMSDAQYEQAIRVIWDIVLEECGWLEKKWN